MLKKFVASVFARIEFEHKICVGNSIYLQKLMQAIQRKEEAGTRIAIDMTANSEFCTIKIE